MNNTNTKTTVYEVITNKVIDGLKKDGLSWFKPWTNNDGEFIVPCNLKTKKEYNGINVLLLSASMRANEWIRPEFVTYKQAEELGGNVKTGEKGNEVIYWLVSYFADGKWYANAKALAKAGHKPSDKGVSENWSPRYFRVFNVAQCEGLKLPKASKPKATSIYQPIESAGSVYRDYYQAPELKHGGQKAFYRPSQDLVQMPRPEAFLSTDDYYKTLFHELVHSTGHSTRLNRKGVSGEASVAFGSDTYSFEELIAEMGSMYLVAFTGVKPSDNDDNSQAYINGWISKLGSEPKWILKAGGAAEKAVKRILNK